MRTHDLFLPRKSTVVRTFKVEVIDDPGPPITHSEVREEVTFPDYYYMRRFSCSGGETRGTKISRGGKRAQYLVPTAMSYHINEGMSGYIGVHISENTDVTDRTVITGLTTTDFSPPDYAGFPGNINNEVYNKAVSKLFDEIRGDLDWSVNAFQTSQTIALAKRIKKLVGYVRNIPKKVIMSSLAAHKSNAIAGVKRVNIKDVYKDSSSLWLEWIYGLKPIVSDLYETADRYMNGYYPKRSIKKRAGIRGRAEYRKNPDGILEIINVDWSSRCEIRADFAWSHDTLENTARWTSLNPLSIGWELLPYSFVVDWMYNVGGYLRDLESSAVYANSFLSGYVTYTSIVKIDGSRSGTYKPASNLRITENSLASNKLTYKERIPITSIPEPRAPTIRRTMLGTQRLLSAAALLSAFIKR